uniref:Uncharacterized protein n=1 Tax=Anguilla anguilla TaxID=7936 RepID=A0A0E9RQI3_ANGAN
MCVFCWLKEKHSPTSSLFGDGTSVITGFVRS